MFAFPFLGGVARIVLLIPFAIWSQVFGRGAYLAVIVASFPVLFTGRYPVSFFEMARDAARLNFSAVCYGFGLSDEYPSFSVSMDNPGVKWLFIVLGILLLLMQFASSLSGSTASRPAGG